jgi:hypothetical protein
MCPSPIRATSSTFSRPSVRLACVQPVLRRGDDKHRAAVLRIANWLVRTQTSNGHWVYEFPVTLDGATIGTPRPSSAAQGQAISLLMRFADRGRAALPRDGRQGYRPT